MRIDHFFHIEGIDKIMATLTEIISEIAQIKSAILVLKDLVTNLPPAGVITQPQLDSIDAALDDVISVMSTSPAPAPVTDPNG